MKKLISTILIVSLLLTFGLFALGSGDEEEKTENQGSSTTTTEPSKTNLGNYNIEIKSCRIAEDFEGKKVAIITYGFTNYDDDDASFSFAVKDSAFQNGIGLNKAYILSDSANYSSDNQLKEIKKEASLDVEVAYELNDTTTEILVEVEELISFSDKKITKTFTIA